MNLGLVTFLHVLGFSAQEYKNLDIIIEENKTTLSCYVYNDIRVLKRFNIHVTLDVVNGLECYNGLGGR